MRLIDNETHFQQLNLCVSNFQKTIELIEFNRTLILYEAEWNSKDSLNLLFVLVENETLPMIYYNNLGWQFNEIYSIDCFHRFHSSKGQLRYLNTHEYDRTVIIECSFIEPLIDEQNLSMSLILTHRQNKNLLTLNIDLCWLIFPRLRIGHCHKALFEDVPFYMLEQWLDYHLLLGVEQFYIYDRTLKFRSTLQRYIDLNQVIYIEFPLAKQILNRERFNWIDQFVGKMHCLMRTRRTFQWLGTWDFDEYLNFFAPNENIFIRKSSRSSSMLSEYLENNFYRYNNIIIYAVNFMTKRSLTLDQHDGNHPVLIEQYQHRVNQWNDRVKYFVRPNHCRIINIHYALFITDNSTYESFLPNPSRIFPASPQTLIRINHYSSGQINRDELFLALHQGPVEYVHDPLLYRVAKTLHSLNNQQ